MEKEDVIRFLNEYRFRIKKILWIEDIRDLVGLNLEFYYWLIENENINESFIVLENEYKINKKVYFIKKKEYQISTIKYWNSFYEVINNNIDSISLILKGDVLDYGLIDEKDDEIFVDELYDIICFVLNELVKTKKNKVLLELKNRKLIKKYQSSIHYYPDPLMDLYDEWQLRVGGSFPRKDFSPETSWMIIQNPLYNDEDSYGLEIPGEPYDDILTGEYDNKKYDINMIKHEIYQRHFMLSEFLYDYFINDKKKEYERFKDYPSEPLLSQYTISYKEGLLDCGEYGSDSFKADKIYGQILSIICKDKNLNISFMEAKREIPTLILNDFHRYKVYLNKKFKESFKKGNINIHLKLVNEIFSKRGNPALKISVID